MGDSIKVNDESDRLEETEEDSEKTESSSSDAPLPTDEADSSDICSTNEGTNEAAGSICVGRS